MSAFIVSPKTIRVVCRFYKHLSRYQLGKHFNFENGVKLLLDENIKSIKYRYPDLTGNEITSFLPDYDYNTYLAEAQSFIITDLQYKPIEIIRACHCIEYQSCEHPDYYNSDAFNLLHDIIKSAIYNIPGYEEARGEL